MSSVLLWSPSLISSKSTESRLSFLNIACFILRLLNCQIILNYVMDETEKYETSNLLLEFVLVTRIPGLFSSWVLAVVVLVVEFDVSFPEDFFRSEALWVAEGSSLKRLGVSPEEEERRERTFLFLTICSVSLKELFSLKFLKTDVSCQFLKHCSRSFKKLLKNYCHSPDDNENDIWYSNCW